MHRTVLNVGAPVFLALVLGLSSPVVRVACAQEDAENSRSAESMAIQAALSWLHLVDAGRYTRSWEEAAPLFQNAVTREQWKLSLEAVRSPLGACMQRQVKTATYATVLPGAPDGEYVVIQFDTAFADKARAVETVTPARTPDGVWRVSGYYIR